MNVERLQAALQLTPRQHAVSVRVKIEEHVLQVLLVLADLLADSRADLLGEPSGRVRAAEHRDELVVVDHVVPVPIDRLHRRAELLLAKTLARLPQATLELSGRQRACGRPTALIRVPVSKDLLHVLGVPVHPVLQMLDEGEGQPTPVRRRAIEGGRAAADAAAPAPAAAAAAATAMTSGTAPPTVITVAPRATAAPARGHRQPLRLDANAAQIVRAAQLSCVFAPAVLRRRSTQAQQE